MESSQSTDFLGLLRWIDAHAELEIDDAELLLIVPRGNEQVDQYLNAALDGLALPGGELQRSSSQHPWRLAGVLGFDVLGQLLENETVREVAPTTRLWSKFLLYAQRPPLPRGPGINTPILVQRLCAEAVIPTKSRPSDSGYDVTLIAERRRINEVILYGTGLIVQPPEGYYFDVVARSSIIKTGHMLANNVGIIDRAYRGELLVPLVKLDSDAPSLELPVRLVQLIPRPIVHFSVELVDDLTYTSRGPGGFGSTG